jgi:hypothetical protein
MSLSKIAGRTLLTGDGKGDLGYKTTYGVNVKG